MKIKNIILPLLSLSIGIPVTAQTLPDSVLVTPFSKISKRQATAAVSTIDLGKMPRSPLSALNHSFAGLVPGLYVSQDNTAPGRDNSSMLIRGRNSYNDGQSPRIFIDGIERTLRNLDLNEIESITILKDAATLSWYGIRGAQGALYITTKQGKIQKTKVTFDASYTGQIAQSLAKPLNAYSFASLYNEALQNSGMNPVYDPGKYVNPDDKYAYPDNNFIDRFLKSSAPAQRYVATVSGGNNVARYFTLVSYYNQQGLFKETQNKDYDSNASYERYNFRTNLDVNLMPDLNLSLYIGGQFGVHKEPGASGGQAGINNVMNAIFYTPANAFPLLNEDGSFGGTSIFQTNNPLALLTHNGYNKQASRSMFASVQANWDLHQLLKGLSANILYSIDVSGIYAYGQNQGYEVYQKTGDTYTRFGNETPLAYANAGFNSNYSNNEVWIGLDYNRTFGEHGLAASVRYNGASTKNPNNLDFDRLNVPARLSYNYAQRYFADFVVSYSGSTLFAPGHRYGFFPAIAAGWIVSDESFFERAKNALPYLKIRASYGLTGCDALFTAPRYAWEELYQLGSSYVFGTAFSSSARGTGTLESFLANKELTYEKNAKFNVGFDSRLISNTLSLSADYFNEVRFDIFTPDYVPGIIGETPVPVNFGKVRSQGMEIEGKYEKQFGKVNLLLFGNYTYANSKILKYNDIFGTLPTQVQTGSRLGNFGNLYQSMGLFQTPEEIDNAPVQKLSGSVKPGDIRYKDVSGPDGIPDGIIDGNDAVRTDKSGLPDSYFGFGAAAGCAGFDLSFHFAGVAGRTVDIQSLVNAGNSNTGYLTEFSEDSWSNVRESKALYPRLILTDRNNNTAASDFWLRSAGYLRLKNLELGYSLPASVVKKMKIGACRFYVSGQNLLTFSKLKTELGLDPEMPGAGHGTTYPYLMTVSGGVNIEF